MAWTTSYYHYDAVGTTRQLTDSAETVTDTYFNDAFGNQLIETGPTENPFRYVGQMGYYWDADLASFYVRQRVYEPVLLRWLRIDPLGFAAYDENLYRYVANNPVNANDSSGAIDTNLLTLTDCDVRGLPTIWIKDLLRYGSVGWGYSDDLPTYQYILNRILVPESYYVGGVACLKDCRSLKCLEIGLLYNELWHAWFDQVLEKRAECKWLYTRIAEEGKRLYTGPIIRGGSRANESQYLAMVEEALSETANNWVFITCRGITPTYANEAADPGHQEEGQLWEHNSFAGITISVELWNLLEHALKFGCRKTGRYPKG